MFCKYFKSASQVDFCGSGIIAVFSPYTTRSGLAENSCECRRFQPRFERTGIESFACQDVEVHLERDGLA